MFGGRSRVGEKAKILLVDDEQYIINALRRALIGVDFEIQSTTDSQEAIELIKSNEFDVILCDQKMAGLRGVDVLDYCRKNSPDTIRILITGYADVNVMAHAINKCKIHYYISKPWNNKELIDIIKENLSDKKINNKKEELFSYILKHKEHLEKIVNSLGSVKITSGGKLSDKSAGDKAQKRMLKIAVKKDDSIVILDPSDIYYLTARKGKVLIFTKNDQYYSWDSMNSWEERLSGFNFFRCHRSYIVNVDKIEEIIPWFNDTCNLKLKDIPDKIYSSKTYTKQLKKRFNIDADSVR
ncbi:MAG: LytTR family transcriptional regulator DNA-binding domain-containing protein [Acetivibrionales bacterium]|jgi:two-component system response regulator LytT